MRKKRCGLEKTRGQVWVETVIYTLIGLTIIGLLLAVSKPQLDKVRDKALIEQSISSMGVIDEKIYETLSGTGNVRRIELKVGKGVFTVDAKDDKMRWALDSHYKYSEVGREVPVGKINVTTEAGSPYRVFLELQSPRDIRFEGKNVNKQIGESSTPHILTVENQGMQNEKTIINFEIV